MTCCNIVLEHLAKYNFSFQKIMFLFPPLVWLPKPCDDLHVRIDNLIWEQIIYLCPQSKCTPCIGLEQLCHQNLGHILPKVALLPIYLGNAYSTHSPFNSFFIFQCCLLSSRVQDYVVELLNKKDVHGNCIIKSNINNIHGDNYTRKRNIKQDIMSPKYKFKLKILKGIKLI